MPLVRVDLHTSLAPQQADLSAAIHKGLVDGLEMPADDLSRSSDSTNRADSSTRRHFRTPTERTSSSSRSCWPRIYSGDDKQRMCRHVVDEIKAIGINQDNVLIAVTENEGSDWFAPEKEA